MTGDTAVDREPDAATPSIADGRQHPLDARFVPAQRLARGIFTAVALGGSLPLMAVFFFLGVVEDTVLLLAPVGWLLAAGLLAWWSWTWPALAYRYASYRVDDAGIEICRGVVWRRVIRVPRTRVQHTDVSQGPIERSYGLGTLVIYTAGTDFARVQLAGLAHSVALAIRDHLLPGEGPDAV